MSDFFFDYIIPIFAIIGIIIICIILSAVAYLTWVSVVQGGVVCG